MHRSPEQRFQRTTNPSVSPTTSATRMSPKYNPINKQSRESNLVKNGENTNIKEGSKQQVDDRIENLQKMLDNEKSKRQVQFNQLYKMINSVKDSKPSRTDNEEPSFLYGELEFPMTPRVKPRQIEVENDQREYKFQTYTPIIQTVSKAKESRHRNYIRDTQDYRNPEEYTLKSVEMLLQKIEREAEYNNRNIFRIQQQISSIRSLVLNSKQRSPKAQEIPQQIHKYIKESHNFLKSQIEADRNMLKKLIVQEVEEQVSIKIKQYKQEKVTADKNQGLKKLQAKIEEMSLYFQQQLKILDEKSDNQIDTLNEIVEEKFSFFKDTILDHVLKYAQEDSNRLSREIEKQKNRISSIQQANAQFFIELENTMGNIQQKLKLVKQSSQHERQLKDVQILRSLKQEQDIFFEEISQQFHRKMATHQQEALTKIRQLSQQVEKMQDLISPPPKFKVSNQNNSSTKNTISPEFESQVNDLSKISKRTNQHELSFEHGNKYMKNEEEQEINQKFNQIMELISENCTFLQSRNCLFEDSMAEIVSVLNDIVEKLKLIM